MPNTNPSDLDREALKWAYAAYDEAFPDAELITYDGLKAAICAYLDHLPRASGVPEVEAVAYIVHHEADGERFLAYSADVDWFKERGYTTEPLYAAPPPVAAPSGETERLVQWTMNFVHNSCGDWENDEALPEYILKTFHMSGTKSTEDAWEASACYSEDREFAPETAPSGAKP